MQVLRTFFSAILVLFRSITTVSNARRHEKNINDRYRAKMQQESSYRQKEFDENTTMSNRELVIKPSQDILACVNSFYEATEQLVINFPETAYTGRHPELLYKKGIINDGVGFPESMQELKKLDTEWRKQSQAFENVITVNRMLISHEIYESLEQFSADCETIKDYFYGRFNNIDIQRLEKEKEEYSKTKADLNKVIKQTTEIRIANKVLEYYTDLTDLRKRIINEINEYVSELTSLDI